MAGQAVGRQAGRLPAAALLLVLSLLVAGRSFAIWTPEPAGRADAQAPAQRRQLIAGLGVAAASPTLPALAFEKYKDTAGLWSFTYPTGLQKSESKTFQFFVRDLIEPLESVGVRVIDTKRKSLDEIGDATAVAEKLLDDVVPQGAPREIIKAESKTDKSGRRIDIIEYRYQWKFDKVMAERLGRQRFQLHCRALVAVDRKKQFLVIAAVEENRWDIAGDLLSSAIETFNLEV